MRATSLLFLACTAALGAACAGRTHTNPIAPYAGTWEGRVLELRSDSVRLTWTWVQSRDSTGTLTLGRDGVSLPTRVVAASPDSIVVEAVKGARLPLIDAPEFAIKFVGRAAGNKMTGTAVATSPLGGAQQGRIEATRVDSTRHR